MPKDTSSSIFLDSYYSNLKDLKDANEVVVVYTEEVKKRIALDADKIRTLENKIRTLESEIKHAQDSSNESVCQGDHNRPSMLKVTRVFPRKEMQAKERAIKKDKKRKRLRKCHSCQKRHHAAGVCPKS